MKCPRCGAASEVAATRTHMEVFMKRARDCFNGHRFHTVEVFAGNLDRRTLASTRRGIVAKAAAWALRRKVQSAAATLSSEALGRQLGVSGARVRQLRQAANDAQARDAG